jgi:hypothetical protein
VSSIPSRIRALVGALGIIACASPLAAQTHHPGAEARAAAQWVGRGQAGFRIQRPWPMRGWRAGRFGWRRGVAAAPGWRAAGWRRAWIRRDLRWRYARPSHPRYRPWRRAGI